MTVYTKTIVAALAVSLGVAPLVGTASADPVSTNSNATLSFTNAAGELNFSEADVVNFGQIDLSTLSDFHPVALNNAGGKIVLENTLANPVGTYGVTVAQTGNWDFSGTEITSANLPVEYNGSSLTNAQNFVSPGTATPPRGFTNKAFNYDAKTFTLDLTGTSNLANALNKAGTSELTWTLTHEPA